MSLSLPVAVDAMGGDFAPDEIVAGALRAHEEYGIPVILVGRPEDLIDTGGLEVLPASQVIAMDADPGSSVRKMKDSSLVRAAEAVRDGAASAMVSAGNTGATMASALLRMGRIRGVARPAIATLLPAPGTTPTVLLDAGANAECSADWLVQFGQMVVKVRGLVETVGSQWCFHRCLLGRAELRRRALLPGQPFQRLSRAKDARKATAPTQSAHKKGPRRASD